MSSASASCLSSSGDGFACSRTRQPAVLSLHMRARERQTDLAVERGGDPDLVLAERLGERGEGESFARLGLVQRDADWREVRVRGRGRRDFLRSVGARCEPLCAIGGEARGPTAVCDILVIRAERRRVYRVKRRRAALY